MDKSLEEQKAHAEKEIYQLENRRYLTFINPEIAKLIDRTPSTVGHALAELEAVGLVKRRWISRCPTQPYHTWRINSLRSFRR